MEIERIIPRKPLISKIEKKPRTNTETNEKSFKDILKFEIDEMKKEKKQKTGKYEKVFNKVINEK